MKKRKRTELGPNRLHLLIPSSNLFLLGMFRKRTRKETPPESESIRLHQGLRNQNKGKLRSGKRGGSMKGQTLVYKFAFASVTQ